MVNAEIRSNVAKDRFEIWSTGNAISVFEEVYISYSEDFWRTRTHLVHNRHALGSGYSAFR
jgi:hypothetical protein